MHSDKPEDSARARTCVCDTWFLFHLKINVKAAVYGEWNKFTNCYIIYLWLNSRTYSPNASRPQLTGHLCPISIYGIPELLREWHKNRSSTTLKRQVYKNETCLLFWWALLTSNQDMDTEISAYTENKNNAIINIKKARWNKTIKQHSLQ
jgi:hypothetical protein